MEISPILNSLNDAQRAAVTASGCRILVLAGAGSGKTRVLVHRIAWLCQAQQVLPYGILAVTFTNKAAGEMRSRVEALLGISASGMWVGTFHGIAHRLLRSHWQLAGLPQTFQIIDSEDQLRVIKRLLKGMELDESIWQPKQMQWFINANKDEAMRAKDLRDDGDPVTEQMIRIYAAYEGVCERSGLVDFAELLLRAWELLQGESDLLLRYRSRFQHILVDEFQDTNSIQYTWLKLLAGDEIPLFAVGDDDQSIYGWRGARVENIQSFGRDYQDVEIYRLEQNYRSTGTILTAANYLIQNNLGRLGKSLWTRDGKGEPIRLFAAYNEQDEARHVAQQITHWVEHGRSLNEVAILYRSNSQSRVFEEVLFAQGIPYKVFGGLRFFERAEIKDALAYLRLASHHADDAAFERIVNLPARGIGERTMAAVRDHGRVHGTSLWEAAGSMVRGTALTARARSAVQRFLELIDAVSNTIVDLPLQKQVQSIIERSGLRRHYDREPGGRGIDRLENLDELVNAARGFNFDPNQYENMSRLDAFLAHAALEAGEGQGVDMRDFVQLMTLHSAKGLEFSLVFLVGMEEGLFPHSMSVGEAGRLQEERRLCYVGVTRAKERLDLSYAESRRQFGTVHNHAPSRFIREIPRELLMDARSHVTMSPSTALGQQRLMRHDDGDDSLRIGQRVVHAGFGEGVVTEYEGSGRHARVQVNFDSAGIKWLMLEYAKLQPV